MPDTAQCETGGQYGRGGPQCANPATHTMAIACVHEHIQTATVCTKHYDRNLLYLSFGRVICRDCRHGTQPHECTVQLVEHRALEAVDADA